MSELIDREALKDAVKRYAGEPTKEKDRKCQAICLDMLGTIDAQPTASPWHRVEVELPDEVGSYLVYAPTYIGGSSSAKECKAGVMFAKWLKGGHWSIEVGYYKRPGCVTHWMPIEPPKEESK